MDREEIPPEVIPLNPVADERVKTSPKNASTSSSDQQRCELRTNHAIVIVVIILILILTGIIVGVLVGIGNAEEGR